MDNKLWGGRMLCKTDVRVCHTVPWVKHHKKSAYITSESSSLKNIARNNRDMYEY